MTQELIKILEEFIKDTEQWSGNVGFFDNDTGSWVCFNPDINLKEFLRWLKAREPELEDK